MMSVLRTIGAAVVAALKAMGRMALMPLRAVENMLMGQAPPVVDLPEIGTSPVKPPVLPALTNDEMWDDHARMLQTWCADSMIEGRPLPVPPSLPRDIKEWSKGLTRDECDIVLNATRAAAIAHIRGLFKLPNVRKIEPLAAAEWKSAPKPVGLDADEDAFTFMPVMPRTC